MNKFSVKLSFYEMTEIIRITQPQSSVLITVANELNHAHNEMQQQIADYKAEAEHAKNMNEYYEAKLASIKDKLLLLQSNRTLLPSSNQLIEEAMSECHV